MPVPIRGIFVAFLSAITLSFELNAQTQTVPVITWASDPVRPDETVILSRGNFDTNAVIELSRLARRFASSAIEGRFRQNDQALEDYYTDSD